MNRPQSQHSAPSQAYPQYLRCPGTKPPRFSTRSPRTQCGSLTSCHGPFHGGPPQNTPNPYHLLTQERSTIQEYLPHHHLPTLTPPNGSKSKSPVSRMEEALPCLHWLMKTWGQCLVFPFSLLEQDSKCSFHLQLVSPLKRTPWAAGNHLGLHDQGDADV